MNIIPERSRMHVSVRAPRDSEMHELKDKVLKIIHAAASSTGCEVIANYCEEREITHLLICGVLHMQRTLCKCNLSI